MQILVILIVLVLAAGALVMIFAGKSVSREEAPGAGEPGEQGSRQKKQFVEQLKQRVSKEKTRSSLLQWLPLIPANPLFQLHINQDLVGRRWDLADLFEQYNNKKKKTILFHGPPGVGKSTLANFMAERLVPKFPDAQLYINLNGDRPTPLTPEEAMARVIHAFQTAAGFPENPKELAALYRTSLYGQKVLVVLDNARNASQVQPLLIPGNFMFLVIARSPLGLKGAYEKEMLPMSEEDASDLFISRVPRANFWAAEFCKICNNLPITLTLMGNFLATSPDLDPGDVSKELREARKNLTAKKIPSGAAGLTAAMRMIYSTLEDLPRAVFHKLSVFPGTFSGKAAEFICEDPGNQSLGQLVLLGLVEEDTERGRYEMHTLIRGFLEKRVSGAEKSLTERRHATYYLTLLMGINDLRKAGGQTESLAPYLFDLEWENIRRGFEIAEASFSKDPDAARLCAGYVESGSHWMALRQTSQDRLRWLNVAIKAARQGEDKDAESHLLRQLGTACLKLNRIEEAIEHLQQARDWYREVEDVENELETLGSLGKALTSAGKTEEALQCHQKELELARVLGKKPAEAEALQHLGEVCKNTGNIQRSAEFLQEARDILQTLGNKILLAPALEQLGNARWELGEHIEAAAAFSGALDLYRTFRNHRSEGRVLQNLGAVYAGQEKNAQAVQSLEKAANLFRKSRDPGSEAMVWMKLGEILGGSEIPREGIEPLQKACGLFEKIGQHEPLSAALDLLIEVHRKMMDFQNAAGALEKQLQTRRKLGDRQGEAESLQQLGRVLEQSGKPREARQHAEAALKIYQEIKHPEAETVRKQLGKKPPKGKE